MPRPADIEGHRCLRSASSPSLIVRGTRLSTVGDRAFLVAASLVWNDLSRLQNLCLSYAVTSRLISLGAAFRDTLTVVVPEKWLCHSGHVNRFCYLLTYLLTMWGPVEWHMISTVNCLHWYISTTICTKKRSQCNPLANNKMLSLDERDTSVINLPDLYHE